MNAKSGIFGGHEQVRRLDELRPRYERLKADRIRAESEIERLSRELEEARREAREAFGCDDEVSLARLIEETRAENAAHIADFEARLAVVEAGLDALDPEA